MEPTDRLHSLDAVRASALLLGIALHATSPWMAGMGWLAQEAPNDVLASIWFVVHIFRMPMFFLIAGFFGRLMLELKGMTPFIKDRSKRILIPLFAGWPIVMLLMAAAFVVGAMATGVDLMAYAANAQAEAVEQAEAQAEEGGALWNWAHLWFLYYLVIFYAAAVVVRVAFDRAVDRGGALRRALDAVVRFIMGGVWGPIILAAPLAAWFVYQGDGWRSWFGIYPPTDIIPDPTALIGHGLAFALGWMLHRQRSLLLGLQKSWILYGVLAVALTVVCVRIAGLTPQWEPYLETEGWTLPVYAVLYTVATWCWIFALVGAAERFLSSPSPARRYIADASYWLYLMHLPVLVFFGVVFQAIGWHWTIEYVLTLTGTVAVLLLSYHTLVRFTVIGAILNGRRHPRPSSQPAMTPA